LDTRTLPDDNNYYNDNNNKYYYYYDQSQSISTAGCMLRPDWTHENPNTSVNPGFLKWPK